MQTERWQKISELFQAALKRDSNQRSAFLAEACAGDEALRSEVESLISSHEKASDFIESPVFEVAAPLFADERVRLSAGTSIGAYKILSLLGAGGMGEVYLAEDTKLSRKVAIKVLPSKSLGDERAHERLMREAQSVASLDHPNICSIYEVCEEGGNSFIVMPYVKGETLAARIDRHPMELQEALDVAAQVADALVEAHSHRIIHRDIKPQNIMLTARGQAKVMDFGLAKLIEGEAPLETAATTKSLLTDSGAIVGTAPYMSPEQARGEQLDARSDLFSFGAVLYEMITGRPPFAAESAAATFSAILTREPLPIIRYSPDAPAELDRIVAKALTKDREERYQTAKDLFIDLKRLKHRREIEAEIERSMHPASGGPGTSAVEVKVETANEAVAKTGDASRTYPTSSAEYLITQIKHHKIGVSLAAGILVMAVAAIFYGPSLIREKLQPDQTPAQRVLTRLTFDPGLQSEPTWSPDGRFISYSSDKSGNFDIWVQPVGEGNAVQVTHSPAHDWQPDWSPDGKRIAFRSEREGGGLYVVPALGGSERKISSFGYHPRWSPDGTKILFDTQALGTAIPTLYVTALDGSPPREILTDFFKDFAGLLGSYVGWHPDSRRISVWAVRRQAGREFWTVPIDGGPPVRSEISSEVDTRLKEASVALARFVWSPSSQALYFEGVSRGVTNLWKITVEPKSLRWTSGPERLTTGPGKDSDITISPDGKKLAFTTRTEITRVWVMPFDAATGQIKGEGKAETPAGTDAWALELSPDGKKLAYVTLRPGKQELWVKSLDDGNEKLLRAADEDFRGYLCWSHDGAWLAYRSTTPAKPGDPGGVSSPSLRPAKTSIVVMPSEGGDEQVITSNGTGDGPKDWFSDGRRVLALTTRPDGERWKVWIVPVAAAPHAEEQAQIIASDPGYDFYQPHLSPDERWICFMKVKGTERGVSNLYVMPASGGEQTQITAGEHFDDKLRWSPDGKTIYFLSQRGGFFNVWGVHFDSVTGKPVGEPFRVTSFENPGRMATPANTQSEMSVSANRLALPITELSGGIWVLENVDR